MNDNVSFDARILVPKKAVCLSVCLSQAGISHFVRGSGACTRPTTAIIDVFALFGPQKEYVHHD
jgi:hypothetical protein